MPQLTYVFLIGGAALAVYLVASREEGATFEEGFAAGWIAPGPLTVAAAVGGLIYFFG